MARNQSTGDIGGGSPLRDRMTRIIATLGPASSSPESIAALFDAGADMFRLNFSHGSHEEHRERVRILRSLEEQSGRPIPVMADLQGPKIRIGRFQDGAVTLQPGDRFRLDLEDQPGDARRVQLPHREVFGSLRRGSELLLDDGRIRLTVRRHDERAADTAVTVGGRLSDAKGVNLPDVDLRLSALTPKDMRDLAFALDLGVDWVALSFVQRPDDVAAARKLIGARAGLMAKLEKPLAIDRLEEIVELADAVMVARGDLGVELPPEDVPGLQKRIGAECRRAGKPAVVATQMLESMIHAPAPTRAEATDVATAVGEGVDAVMLSGETAVGSYPVEAVAMMDRIIRRAERDPSHRMALDAIRARPDPTTADAISAAARQIAETVSAVAIVTYTATGATALRISRERPPVPILVLASDDALARRLALCWGVFAVPGEPSASVEEVIAAAGRAVIRTGLGRTGDRAVLIGGLPLGTPGATNFIHIATLRGGARRS